MTKMFAMARMESRDSLRLNSTSVFAYLAYFAVNSFFIFLLFPSDCGSGELTPFRFFCYHGKMIDFSIAPNGQANGLNHLSRGQRPRKNALKGSRPVQAIQNFSQNERGKYNHL
jgi:hypothetical protein